MEVRNNWGDEPIEVWIAQFRSETFDSKPPQSFTEDLIVRQVRVSLAPHERRVLKFNDASGGLWLRWRLLSPMPEPNHAFTLSLASGERRIDVQRSLH